MFSMKYTNPKPNTPVHAVARMTISKKRLRVNLLPPLPSDAADGIRSTFQRGQKKTITANIVPVCSMTSRKVASGESGLIPMSFSARITNIVLVKTAGLREEEPGEGLAGQC